MATGLYEGPKSFFSDTIVPVAAEGLRLLPDSLLYGTGILSLITYQTPMLFLFGVVVISFASSYLLSMALNALMPQDVPPATASKACIPGLYSPSAERITLLSELVNTSGFPSIPMYVLSTVIAYCIGGLIQQADILNELGPDYKAKLPTVMVLSAILVFVFVLYLMMNECNSFLTIMASILLGVIIGGLCSIFIPIIFGQEAINILGLPLFVRRDQAGQPLYICASKQ